ncbi:hypothetical protein [Sulfuriflexus mobilis]|uniref:hypothetical protein n=1 Tax=Sulfuriflexus mobilis TaxID=1811807 RepID=UPI000F83DFB9|nr:hypothetical protein [Sulfuriflexus mobilis]
MNHYTGALLAVLSSITSSLPISAQANDFEVVLPSYITESIVEGDALAGVNGAVGINLVAGDANLQANAAAIAISATGIARSRIASHQATALGQGTVPDISITSIRGNAFSNSTGILSINQISGVSNTQANGIAYGVGVEAITDVELSQSITGYAIAPVVKGLDKPGIRIADIESTAFENSRGIVQINQTAGSGNATRNNFALRISTGAK